MKGGGALYAPNPIVVFFELIHWRWWFVVLFGLILWRRRSPRIHLTHVSINFYLTVYWLYRGMGVLSDWPKGRASIYDILQ